MYKTVEQNDPRLAISPRHCAASAGETIGRLLEQCGKDIPGVLKKMGGDAVNVRVADSIVDMFVGKKHVARVNLLEYERAAQQEGKGEDDPAPPPLYVTEYTIRAINDELKKALSAYLNKNLLTHIEHI